MVRNWLKCRPIDFPASDSHAVAISAIGHTDGLPPNAFEKIYIARRSQSKNKVFLADFSNRGATGSGAKIDRFVGPGVGVISTSRNGGYGVRSGTSMACAAATGALARLLSLPENHEWKGMRGEQRSKAIIDLARNKATSLGLGDSEGFGLLP
ncbi:MAG: S8 family serine peptidase [Isosphaerales bacterium]